MVNPVRSEEMFVTHMRNHIYKTDIQKPFISNFVFEAKRIMFLGGGGFSLNPTPEEARDVFQLRDVVLPTFAVLGQQRQVLQVFTARVGGIQLDELPVHNTPSLHFLLRELNTRNGIPTRMRKYFSIKFNLNKFPK